MGSLATFKTTYLNPSAPVLPIGNRFALAGLIYAVERQVADGNSYAGAVSAVTPRQRQDQLFQAQLAAAPVQAALISDYLAINAA